MAIRLYRDIPNDDINSPRAKNKFLLDQSWVSEAHSRLFYLPRRIAKHPTLHQIIKEEFAYYKEGWKTVRGDHDTFFAESAKTLKFCYIFSSCT